MLFVRATKYLREQSISCTGKTIDICVHGNIYDLLIVNSKRVIKLQINLVEMRLRDFTEVASEAASSSLVPISPQKAILIIGKHIWIKLLSICKIEKIEQIRYGDPSTCKNCLPRVLSRLLILLNH